LKLKVKKLVAVDGAYALFPEARASSGVIAHRELERCCRQYGIELIHHVPRTVWEGNEVQKRDFMFRLAEKHSTDRDWYFVIDDDERVTEVPRSGARLLGDVAYAILTEADGSSQPIRCFFRAQRGLAVRHNHFTYVCGDQLLWGGPEDGKNPREAFAVDSGVTMQHLGHKRSDARKDQKVQYYADRDNTRIENLKCAWCDNFTPDRIPAMWQMTDTGPLAYIVGCCSDCEEMATERGRKEFAALVGSTSASVTFLPTRTADLTGPGAVAVNLKT